MDFSDLLAELSIDREAYNPFAGNIDGKWIEGTISIDWLNDNFSKFETASEMIGAAKSEGLKLYFAWLRDEGILD